MQPLVQADLGLDRPTAYVDTHLDDWRNLSGGQHRAYLSRYWKSFSHTFTINETDLKARVA